MTGPRTTPPAPSPTAAELPELPEVEVVRRGLADHVGRAHRSPPSGPAPARGPPPPGGAADLAAALVGRTHRRHRPTRQVPVDGPRPMACRRRCARAPRDERPAARAARRPARRDPPAGAGPLRRRRPRAALRRPAHVRRAHLGRHGRRSTARRAGAGRAHRPATRSTRGSTSRRSVGVCRRRTPRSSARCSTRPWCRGSATSTPTRRCGGPSARRAPAATLTRPRPARPARRRRAT